jgi:hypothetical protein
MSQSKERRQFERLQIPEDAIATDDRDGSELGRVSQAGGGGFLIFPATEQAVKKLAVGNRLRVTIREPKSKATNTVDVEVRYRKGEALGVEFAGPEKG